MYVSIFQYINLVHKLEKICFRDITKWTFNRHAPSLLKILNMIQSNSLCDRYWWWFWALLMHSLENPGPTLNNFVICLCPYMCFIVFYLCVVSNLLAAPGSKFAFLMSLFSPTLFSIMCGTQPQSNQCYWLTKWWI